MNKIQSKDDKIGSYEINKMIKYTSKARDVMD